MASFASAEHLERIFDAFFTRVSSRADIAAALLAGRFVLRLRYKEPEAQVTIDLRGDRLAWTFGESPLEPDLELLQSGDIANRFWQGRLSITSAIATRKVISRGPIQKALALLPALKPAYPLYVSVLEELGESALVLPKDSGRAGLSGALGRVRADLRRGLDRLLLRRSPVDVSIRPGPTVPLTDAPIDLRRRYREVALPTTDRELHREMLARMHLIRAFEERLGAEWAKGNVPTQAIHLSVGQEAVAVGVCFALRTDDFMATTHRGHGHMLAKGADLDAMMAEMLGRSTGLCHGKGGSMHVTDATVGAIGANGIVGASPLVAAGAAHGARLRGTDQVAVAFMGDGATNQGMFHEALNFAAVLGLPAVFVVENNGYGEFTALADHCRVERLADRAAAYGIAGQRVDGNDVLAVYEATRAAVERARAGEGPTLLECVTYRWHGHMEGESVAYRDPAEIAAWREKCPVERFGRALVESGTITAADRDVMAEDAVSRVASAWEKAQRAPTPAPDALFEDVFAPDPRALWTPRSGEAGGRRELSTSQAIFEALAGEIERDERVYMLGEDVTTGGYFAVTAGLVDRFGRARIVDTPISEYAIVGSAVGAAMTGMRPVCEILFSDFLTTCMDPIVNQAAKLRTMSGGQYAMPLVVRTPGGAGLGMAAQHSQSLEPWLCGIPGLIVVAPGTPADAKGLLASAIRSNNPVIVFENKLLYAETGPVPEGEHLVPLGVACVRREGRDVTVVSVGAVLSRVLEAAERLDARGISVEVVDLRTLAPLDLPTILRSVERTRRLVTVEDAPVHHGMGAEVIARVVERAHAHLRRAPVRVGGALVPIPYDSGLENLALPTVESIVRAVEGGM